jgi:jumonji domain-containing protein 7
MTSFHSDPYENCYAMVAGSKTFKLLPPSDMYRMRMKQYRLATYQPGGTCGPANSCEPSPAGISREESLDTLTAVLSGSVPLEPVVEQPAQHVLWSSVPPTPVNESGGAGALAADAAGNACDLFDDPSLPAPICVTVHAGETLYLPARWWHQVGMFCVLACLLANLARKPAWRCITHSLHGLFQHCKHLPACLCLLQCA